MGKSIQSVERAAAVLRVVGAAGRPVELAEIAQALDLPRTTTHGIVRTLREVGLLTQAPERSAYSLGERIGALGRAHLDPNDVRSLTTNFADALAARSRQQVLIGAPSPDGVVVLHHVFRPDNRAQRLRIGEVLPYHATAIGQATLAFAPRVAGGGLLLDRYTRRTVSTRAALEQTLAGVRARGHACERGEYDLEIGAIAAPLRTYGGLGAGAVSVVGPVEAVTTPQGAGRPELVRLVMDSAASMTLAIVTRR